MTPSPAVPADAHGEAADVNQFSIITELLGTPPDDVIQTIASENVRSPSIPYIQTPR